MYTVIETECERCGELNAHLTADCPQLSSPDLIDIGTPCELVPIDFPTCDPSDGSDHTFDGWCPCLPWNRFVQ